MTAQAFTRYTLTALFLTASVSSAFSQKKEDENELKLNGNAVKMIQFDFCQPREEGTLKKMVEAPLEKRWMKFKETVSFKRSFADTTTVKQIKGYVRPEPYTVWTRFGENPVYDVMPSIEKSWEIHWHLNPFGDITEEYGHYLKPSTGKGYQRATGSAGVGASITMDFDKFLFEHLSARGRAIRHNRKHARAWETYADYMPTLSDSIKMPNIWKKKAVFSHVHPADSVQLSHNSKDSISSTIPAPKKLSKKKKEEIEKVTSIEEYIRRRAAEDSIRRKEFLRKDKERRNAYDVNRESQRLNDRRN